MEGLRCCVKEFGLDPEGGGEKLKPLCVERV